MSSCCILLWKSYGAAVCCVVCGCRFQLENIFGGCWQPVERFQPQRKTANSEGLTLPRCDLSSERRRSRLFHLPVTNLSPLLRSDEHVSVCKIWTRNLEILKMFFYNIRKEKLKLMKLFSKHTFSGVWPFSCLQKHKNNRINVVNEDFFPSELKV